MLMHVNYHNKTYIGLKEWISLSSNLVTQLFFSFWAYIYEYMQYICTDRKSVV